MDFWQRVFLKTYWKVVLTAAAILLAVEITFRFGFGLGDPPLEIPDPACGYRFSPSQVVARFGNRVSYDANSARGDCADPTSGPVWKTLVIGDSVLDGGALTDDRDTATEVLNALSLKPNGRSLRFMNLSAGSWAPPQQLGYLNAYGTLGADSIVLVLSSHDALGPVKGDKLPFPTQKPWTATEEVVLRYFLGFRRHLFASASEGWAAAAANVPSHIASSEDPAATSIWCLKQIVALCRQKNMPVAVVLWPTRSEVLKDRWATSADALLTAITEEKVSHIDLTKQIRATPDYETSVYRDDIHPTPNGQRLIAGAVLELTLRTDSEGL